MIDTSIKASDILNISATALQQLYKVLQLEEHKGKKLRFFVSGGGCGMQYGFYPEATVNSDDITIDHVVQLENNQQKTLKVVIDSNSLPFLKGAIIDYNPASESFSIDNPNAKSSCGGCSGCGH